MIPTSQPKSPHRLARFVTKETAALIFHLKPEQIYRIECWKNVVYVHGKGISKFVSYADFPPILGVEVPTEADLSYWRKRWKKTQKPGKRNYAPPFWLQFFVYHFEQATSLTELYQWGELLAVVKSAFSLAILEQLREQYRSAFTRISRLSVVTA